MANIKVRYTGSFRILFLDVSLLTICHCNHNKSRVAVAAEEGQIFEVDSRLHGNDRRKALCDRIEGFNDLLKKRRYKVLSLPSSHNVNLRGSDKCIRRTNILWVA